MNRIVVALPLVALVSFASAAQRASRPSPPSPAATPPAARTERAVPFKVGETLTNDVSWSSVLTAGTAVTTVMEKKPSFNSSAYYIVAEGRPIPLVARLYTLSYKMDTLVDSLTLLSERGSLSSEEGTRHRLGTTRFDRPARRAFFELQTETMVKADFAVPPQAQDGLSAVYALRAMMFKAGDLVTIPVANDGALFSVRVQVGSLERVKVPLGELSAWNLKAAIVDAQGEGVGRNVAMWISNDARRLPVKLQAELPAGEFVLALREAR